MHTKLSLIFFLLLLGCSGDGFTGQSFDRSNSKNDRSDADQDEDNESEDPEDSSADIPDDVLGVYLVTCETVKSDENTGATCQVSNSKSKDLITEEIKVSSLEIVDQENTTLGSVDPDEIEYPFAGIFSFTMPSNVWTKKTMLELDYSVAGEKHSQSVGQKQITEKKSPTVQEEAHTTECEGKFLNDSCWYLGIAGQSCTQVCNGHGTCDEMAVKNKVGTGANLAACGEVLDLLGASYAVLQEAPPQGEIITGCSVIFPTAGVLGSNPSCGAAFPLASRVCACSN